MNNNVSTYTINQTAKLLNVSKKTLMRWDESGKFSARRDSNNFRRYDKKVVDDHVVWFAIRRKHKEHLRKLMPIRAEVDKFIRTTPITDISPPRVFDYKEMKKAYDALHDWEQSEEKIVEEYALLPKGFMHLVSPES